MDGVNEVSQVVQVAHTSLLSASDDDIGDCGSGCLASDP